jgi:hypothetical protein
MAITRENLGRANVLVLLISLLAFGNVYAQEIQGRAKETPEQILKSFPSTIGAFIAENPHLYNDNPMDVSIGYNDPTGVALTFYLYAAGTGDIEDGITSKIILDQKQGIINEIKDTKIYQNLSLVYDDKQDFKLGNGKKATVFFTQFSLQSLDPNGTLSEVLSSDLYLLGAKGYVCEIRITRPKSTPENKEQEIKKVITELLSRVVN